jgi:hypothetical protein
LRHSSTVSDLADSLDNLEKLLKEPGDVEVEFEKQKSRTGSIVEADLQLQFDFAGLSLKALASSQTPGDTKTISRQPQTVEECMAP